MAAPKGNKFWKMRSSHGHAPRFRTGKILWEACQEYFDWVDANPLWEAKAFPWRGRIKVDYVPKMRAMTIEGLCIFLDITRSTWDNYRVREGYEKIVAKAEMIIRDQKFAGAAAELFNHSIIARDLGLADKREHDGKIAVTKIECEIVRPDPQNTDG